ncbi:hypothetical protein [Bythopirellula polymerisocia]|uniref:Uncharacterized protein n=1 Tax=Bythopirellula polymerisocia TaxID=2528003 RepID=A0A5C6CHB4_9BACT|nr:hypothetical protein [Bythopirellula polymerisocia]TWU22606.1 hypothetical protein Pla144_40660 [Bythopirellula polymerisocia]
MKALHTSKFGNAVRLSALYGSAIAALLCGIAFATDRPLFSHYEEILSGNIDYYGVRIYLGLLLGVFLSYLLAANSNKRLAVAGSLLAICAVGGMFAWYRTIHNASLDAFVAALASPALLHIVAVGSEARSFEREVVPVPSEPVQVVGAYEAA